MRINTLLMTVFLATGLLVTPQTIQAQKNGEAQTVIFDTQNRPTLKFAAKNEKLDCCGLFLTYTVMDNGEEALALKVGHAHRQTWGAVTFPESGWLYISASRVVFVIEEGDRSHAFDLPRTALQDKPGSKPSIDWSGNNWTGIQINLKERHPASKSREQKFNFISWFDSKCKLDDLSPVEEFMERVVNDFVNTMAEFKQLATTLKETGKIQQIGILVLPPADPIKTVADTAGNTSSLSGNPADRTRGDAVTTGVELKVKPRAVVYIDGKFHSSSSTPSKVPLSVGEHTVKLIRCGYKIWEEKIKVEAGALTTLNAILEKQ